MISGASDAWEAWAEQIGKALPPGQFPPKDLPKDHPLFRSIFDIGGGVPQIASIGNWLGTGSTSERGAESAVPHARARLRSVRAASWR